MGVEGGMKCVKFLLFFFNFIFWICGLALIIVGILVQVAFHDNLMIKDASASAIPILIIAVGVIIFFIAFFGCCGAWKENYCMVTTFAILLSVIIIIEIGAAIAGYIYRGKITTIVQTGLADMITKYNTSEEITQAVNRLQKDLKCCGANNASDWVKYMPDGISVPDSCCITITTNCGHETMLDASKVYQKGCSSAMEQVLKKNIQWIIVAALVIAFLQIMGIVFSCMLMRGIRSGYEVM